MSAQFSRWESRRSTLVALKPGESALFVGYAGQPAHKIQAVISAEFGKAGLVSTNYSQKKALLIIDETEAPIACTIVTRNA